MNIEKIKNYNQLMLAAIVTIAAAFAAFGLIAFVIFLFTEVLDVFPRRYNNPVNYETGIPADNFNADESQENANKLHVAYHFPELIDTANQLYIIPIGHRTEYELSQDYSRKLIFSESKTYGSYDGYDPYQYTNRTYANLLVYDAKNGKQDILFKQKILIGQYMPKYFKDDIWILFEAATADSDKSGILSLADQTSLFIYSFRTKSLKQIRYGTISVLEYQFIGENKDIIVRFGVDPTLRKTENETYTKAVLCKYSYDTDNLSLINDDKLHKELQDIIEKKQ